MKSVMFIICMIFCLAFNVKATTWHTSDHVCPVCKHSHEYQVWASYGGYIYQWPSKFQYVFWPLTDSPSVYCCPECKFSTYMWDFDSIPANKVDPLAKMLSSVKLEKKYKEYSDIPMTTRLEIAEDVYKILGRKDEFWCGFYRLKGYHYDKENNKEKAKESRLKSLDIAKLMLQDSLYFGQEKEIYFIIAAMNNFTGHKDSALVYFDKASKLTYKNNKFEEEEQVSIDEYLTALITEYKELILKGDDD